MKNLSSTVLAVLSLSCLSAAHMQMSDPPPLLSKYNKYTTNTDYDMTSPLHADGSNYPCKGHLDVLDTDQAQPVAEWTPGQSYSMTVSGGTPHNGGSCQASLSFDKGKSWKVIHSYIGNCPVMGDSKYEFTLPRDTPGGEMLFAWTWFNQVGNREMYMNCAVINVKDGGSKKKRGSTHSMSSRPDMFVANVGNDCGTVEGKDLMFPDPGPDVDMDSKNTAPPTGSCQSTPDSTDSSADSTDSESSESSSSSSSNASSESPSSNPSDSSDFSADSSPKSAMGQKSGSSPGILKSDPEPPTDPTHIMNSSGTMHGMQNPPKMPPKPSMDTPSPSRPMKSWTPPATGDKSGSCQPGTYACTTNPEGWEVCDVSGKWVHAGDCGPGQVCKFNKDNMSPYCVPPGFKFP